MKRERQRDKEELQERKQMFGREVRNYFLDEDKINVYRSFYGERPETIFRAETNEAAKRHEDVINELNSIDRCFVNDDADGISEIMKRAEANTELSNWNKLRIINECRSALFDLCLILGCGAGFPHKRILWKVLFFYPAREGSIKICVGEEKRRRSPWIGLDSAAEG